MCRPHRNPDSRVVLFKDLGWACYHPVFLLRGFPTVQKMLGLRHNGKIVSGEVFFWLNAPSIMKYENAMDLAGSD